MRIDVIRDSQTIVFQVADVDDDSTPTPVITKTDEEAQQIRNAVQDNILFTSLDEDQMKVCHTLPAGILVYSC